MAPERFQGGKPGRQGEFVLGARTSSSALATRTDLGKVKAVRLRLLLPATFLFQERTRRSALPAFLRQKRHKSLITFRNILLSLQSGTFAALRIEFTAKL
jgi:hypothetical protein